MATLGPCFSDDLELERSSCPTNAYCSSVFGMCVCMLDFLKNGTRCVSYHPQFRKKFSKGNDNLNNKNYFKNKNQQLINSNDDQLRIHSFSNTLSMQMNTLTSSNIVISKTASSKSGPREIDDNHGESQQNLRHNIEQISSSKSIPTTTISSKPHKGRLNAVGSKSSYVPWQMKF